jgi:uncharacterized protein
MDKEIKIYLETINFHLDELKDTYGVSSIGVFGSTATGDRKETSDIDVLVDFSKPISMLRFVALERRLSEILGKPVDLVTKNALKRAIKQDVLKETVYA